MYWSGVEVSNVQQHQFNLDFDIPSGDINPSCNTGP